MNILITGIAGLIGSRLAEYILQNTNFNVIGIDSVEEWGNEISNVPSEVVLYKRNLSKDKIDDIFKTHNIDIVFHFAAYAAEGLSPFMRQFNYDNNIGATVNIINNCISYKVKRLVFTSSMSVYGNGVKPGQRFNEEDLLLPIDPYAIGKYACECDIKVAGEQHGLDWCIVRPHNVFGRNQNLNDKYRNVLGIWMHQIYDGKPMTIYGDGEQVRAFTEVSNILPCLLKTALDEKCSKQVINLGGIKEYTINQAASILSNITGFNDIIHLEPRFEVKYAVPTFEKSIEYLEYKEDCDFSTGLKNMWEWAQNGHIKEWFQWSNFEITDKIYSYWKK